MKDKQYLIFFGAAGAGNSFAKHTSTIPDYYIDNDKDKWGQKLNGVKIKPPSCLTSDFICQINKIIITTGYVKSVLPQLIKMGIPRNIIEIPPKALLAPNPFISERNKIESTKFLDILINTDHKMHVVVGGGTALGFYRDADFIKWDTDIDLFASNKSIEKLIVLIKNLGCSHYIENDEIKAVYTLSNNDSLPFSIKLFNPEEKTYIDVFENYTWKWPTEMFLNSKTVNIHGYKLKLPNPPEKYLEGVYGKSWRIPNPEFSYDNYGK
jgi:predicted nucleotidyltransferase